MTTLPSSLFRWWSLLHRTAGAIGRVHRCRPHAGHPGTLADVHPVPTLVCCLAGCLRLDTEQGRFDLQAGDLALIETGTTHEHHPLRPGCLALEQGFIAKEADLVLRDSQTAWHARLPGSVLRGHLEQTLGARTSELMARGAAAILTAYLDLPWESTQVLPPATQRMYDFMLRSSRRPIGAAKILAASGLARSQAHAAFLSAFGVPPGQALTRRRCLLAQNLLQRGLPIAEVAQRCGYRDRSTFQRAYARTTGRSPCEERGIIPPEALLP